MALFTDGAISRIEDLRAYETAILDVASGEGVDLTVKLALAERELEVEIGRFLSVHDGRDPLDLTGVVATEPLKQWHALHSLALVYRDLYSNQLNDRYLGKWKEYARLAERAEWVLKQSGIGLTASPVRRAAPPELLCEAGPGPEGTYYVRASWENLYGSEGAPSELNALPAPAGNRLVVRPAAAPPEAAGWHVYAGTSAEALYRQNTVKLAPEAEWRAPDSGLRTGPEPGDGQRPQRYVRQQRVLRRG